MTHTIYKKICLLGDFAVGKTSLVRRYVDNQFGDEYLSTIGVKISRKLVQTEESRLQLVIWDIEGRSSFSEGMNAYLQGASGAVIVGDVTRSETVANIANHISSFLTINPRSVIVVAQNKADLLERASDGALRLEDQERVIHWQLTSARNGSGVQTIFETLSRELIEK